MMFPSGRNWSATFVLGIGVATVLAGCGRSPDASAVAAASSAAIGPVSGQDQGTPPPDKTAGFDGQRAYAHVAKIVAFGPRPAGSDGIHHVQEYIHAQLKDFGCPVDDDDFRASTPIGQVQMKNIIAKAPGKGSGIIMLTTHYDSGADGQAPRDKFLGADDGGSSTGLMLELARHLCKRQNAENIWITFFDGEEAFGQWSDTNGTFGSRELAAKLALSGDLKRINAFLLADLVGGANLQLKREQYSTPWLTDLVWNTAKRLGYGDIFVGATTPIEDDHLAFLHRNVPSVDVVDCCDQPYWHTLNDTLDKVHARSLAIVGHVFLASIPEIEKRQK